MTWPSKRVQNTALWRYTSPDTIDTGGRARVVRKRETRRLVNKTASGHDRRVKR